ncbi:MAG: lysophospholipase L1-like esterase [Glaciecola sp.]|jgi:lysophospholipase L1-like esterase
MKKAVIRQMVLLLVVLSQQNIYSQQIIQLDNPHIYYEGLFYPNISSEKVELNRHLSSMETNWESGMAGSWIQQWVTTQTGVRIRFKTSSPLIDLEFTKRDGAGTIGTTPNNGFSVFVNNVIIQNSSSLSFTIAHPNPGVSEIFEVSLPNLWGVDFTGMQIEDGYSVEDPGALNQPIYVSIGNSITHGTGQYVSSAKTYPFLLAKQKGWDLHNLAVAGAGLGWATALNTKGKKVDVISILIGFNDWKYLTTALSEHETMYGRLIDSLRSYHPDAQVYCISPLTTTEKAYSAPYEIQDFRDMVVKVVSDRQKSDDKLCFIDGPSISDASMLASGDVVHLSESGASKLADNLYVKTNECGSAALSILNQTNDDVNFRSDSGGIYFTSVESGEYSVRLFNLNGQLLERKQVRTNGSSEVNVTLDLLKTTGIFVVTIQHEKGLTTSHKIIRVN